MVWPDTCDILFEQLVRQGLLYETDKGAYIAQPTTHRASLSATTV
jgi:hypothetical protein